MKTLALLFFCALAAAKDLRNNINPKAYSPAGIYEGTILKSYGGKNIFSFFGIRYAEPPTGENSFKPPIKAKSHQGVYNAAEKGPICPQSYKGPLTVSEDCLRLNVHTAELPQNSTDESSTNPKKPVIVFIHGGGFISGSSYDVGPESVLDQDVVFVTLNYRLGSLGFLATGHPSAPGNAGLKDQVMALKWIQENIRAFGGDPDKVTLIGHGAGSQCVSLHTVSPMSKGLFHFAIMMSGATTTQNPLPLNENDLVEKEAHALGCSTETLDKILDCFHTKLADEFVHSDEQLIKMSGASDPIFIPVIEPKTFGNDKNEEAFLTEQPGEIIMKGKANFVPLYIGVNKHEHEPLVIPAAEQALQGNSTLFDEFNNNWNETAPKRFAYEAGTPKSFEISRKFKSAYLDNKPVTAENYHGVAKLYADSLTIFHVHRFERLMATYSPEPVWYYHNMHENCDSHTHAKWSNGTRFGIVHYDELSLLFNVTGQPAPCERDIRAGKQVWEFIGEFGQSGKPISDDKAKNPPVNWQPSTKDQPQYLEFSSETMKMVQGFIYPERMNLWDEFFPIESTDASKIDTNPIVNSSTGIYEGSIMKSQLGKDIYAFRGIRYAEAPTGENRFKASTLVKRHNGTFDATKDGPICPQPNYGSHEMSEDCLRLSIYTTSLPDESHQPNRSVLVFIHPGGIATTSGTSYELRPHFVLDQEMVFVIINYRVGALGFLSTGDERAPGNAGLKDQVLALKWIQQNIAAFGGDSSQVTLYGYGGSSVDVTLHIVSPMSKGLFHRALVCSGAATTQKPLPINQINLSEKQADVLGCPIDNRNSMFACLYEKSPQQYLDSYTKLTKSSEYSNQVWTPVVEAASINNNIERFLIGQPEDLIREGNASFLPLFIGVNADEQGNLIRPAEEQAQSGNTTLYDELNNNWEKLAPSLFGYESDTPKSSNISRELKTFYLHDKPLKAGNYQGLAKLYADALTIFPVHRFGKLMATYSSAPIYYYLNRYKNCDTLGKWSNGTSFGTVHYDEMPLLYNIDGRPEHCEKDVKAAHLVWKWVFNFVKVSDPTPGNEVKDFPVKWTPSTKDQPEYFDFTNDDMKMVVGSIYQERMKKWEELFPSMTKK